MDQYTKIISDDKGDLLDSELLDSYQNVQITTVPNVSTPNINKQQSIATASMQGELEQLRISNENFKANIEKSQKEIQKEQRKSQDNFDKLNNKIDRLEDSKLTIIETLGIFVALFTFISVDFQVFRSYRNPFAIAGLTLVLLGAIGFLISIFDFFILEARFVKRSDRNKKDNKESWHQKISDSFKNNIGRFFLFFLEICLIFTGIVLFSRSKIEEFEDKAMQIKNDVFEYAQKIQGDFYTKNDLQELIQENKTNKKTLECLKNKEFFTIRCFEN